MANSCCVQKIRGRIGFVGETDEELSHVFVTEAENVVQLVVDPIGQFFLRRHGRCNLIFPTLKDFFKLFSIHTIILRVKIQCRVIHKNQFLNQ